MDTSYNHGKEEGQWQRWKLAEEEVLRACGVDESAIEQLRIWDRTMFNSDRRFYEKLQDAGTYLDSVAESDTPSEIYTVADLLNDIENIELLKALLTADRLTLYISVLKMNGYSTNEIAALVHLSTDAIYKRIAVLKRKLKKFQG
ncbi:MAG: sigma-70 family RNA polymerase sigma factor [Subdoligranulum sp.]|nr:sigma-70 family RNA polymerase sigma factor [Subdoligranulum sp.]